MLPGAKLCTPQHGTHAGQKLIYTEWLGEIVVRPQVKPSNFVLILPACSHNDNWNGREFTNTLADREAIHFRHHYIEQHKVRGLLLNLSQSLLTIADRNHLVPLQL